MQAIKEKFDDMKEMRKVKAETKAEEKAEKELAQARLDVAHEVRLAKEAEASMEMHVAKAEKIAGKEVEKHGVTQPNMSNMGENTNLFETDKLADEPNTMARGNTGNPTGV